MYAKIKRLLDIMFSFIGIVVASPVLAIVALAVKLDSKGPVIFKQERLGKDGKVFLIYKFRSMCVGAEKMGSGQYSFKGDSRITRVGKIIRATSLDELPQFFNIIKGDMSFIGPRPTLTYHPWKLEEYTDFQRRRFEVRPGITGLAQVNGRKKIDWVDRIKYDVEYVDNMSLALDCKILFKTVVNVFMMKDNRNDGKTANESGDNDVKADVHN
ncbi:MAG: sugar transferase [Clostridia bacterium]|nr:sugar transferase [Oscillospiraceae bacterium]MDD6220489.1 sugar transferase [Clostridia bacterium]